MGVTIAIGFGCPALARSLQPNGDLGKKFPLLFLRRGGQTAKSSNVQKYKCSGRGGLFYSEE